MLIFSMSPPYNFSASSQLFLILFFKFPSLGSFRVGLVGVRRDAQFIQNPPSLLILAVKDS